MKFSAVRSPARRDAVFPRTPATRSPLRSAAPSCREKLMEIPGSTAWKTAEKTTSPASTPVSLLQSVAAPCPVRDHGLRGDVSRGHPDPPAGRVRPGAVIAFRHPWDKGVFQSPDAVVPRAVSQHGRSHGRVARRRRAQGGSRSRSRRREPRGPTSAGTRERRPVARRRAPAARSLSPQRHEEQRHPGPGDDARRDAPFPEGIAARAAVGAHDHEVRGEPPRRAHDGACRIPARGFGSRRDAPLPEAPRPAPRGTPALRRFPSPASPGWPRAGACLVHFSDAGELPGVGSHHEEVERAAECPRPAPPQRAGPSRGRGRRRRAPGSCAMPPGPCRAVVRAAASSTGVAPRPMTCWAMAAEEQPPRSALAVRAHDDEVRGELRRVLGDAARHVAHLGLVHVRPHAQARRRSAAAPPRPGTPPPPGG